MTASTTKMPTATRPVPLTSACPTWAGSRATIPPKMIIEMPLPTPYWLISSPIQISSSVPAVIVIMIESVPSGFIAEPEVRDDRLAGEVAFRSCGVPYACASASGTVSQWVIWLILFRPDSPSFEISVRRGITGTSSCMMIEAVIYG